MPSDLLLLLDHLDQLPVVPASSELTASDAPLQGVKMAAQITADDLSPPTVLPPLTANATSPPPHTFVLGTRNSLLALVQTSIVQKRLEALYPDERFQVSGMTTVGDRNLNSPLYLMGGKALWTKDLEVALLSGSVDLIVHSLKDMPTSLPEGCELGAVMAREDPRDALVVRKGLEYKTLAELPDGAVVGTSSVRRVAQLRRRFPGLQFKDIRGNLQTRLGKLDAPDSPFTAIILAVAGLARVDLSHRITSLLSPPDLFHAVGQGALGVEIRTPSWDPPASEDGTGGDAGVTPEERRRRAVKVKEMVESLEDWQSGFGCQAERELLRTLEGGCSVPVGCSTSFVPSSSSSSSREGTLTLQGVVTSLDGDREVLVSRSATVSSVPDCIKLGRSVADALKAQGADAILEELGRLKQAGQEKAAEDGEAGEGVGGEGEVGTRAKAVEELLDTKIVDLSPEQRPVA